MHANHWRGNHVLVPAPLPARAELCQLAKEGEELRQKLQMLTLSNKGVSERERRRPQVPAPWWILGPYYVLCWVRLYPFLLARYAIHALC